MKRFTHTDLDGDRLAIQEAQVQTAGFLFVSVNGDGVYLDRKAVRRLYAKLGRLLARKARK